MGLAERLGDFTRARIGCGVCEWLEQQSDSDRANFDQWVESGGNISQLWRACCATADIDGSPIANPLRVQRPRFSQCVNEHHRGGDRVSG